MAQGPYFSSYDTLDLTLDELRRGRSEWLRTGKPVVMPRVQLTSAGQPPLTRIAVLRGQFTPLRDSLQIWLVAVDDTASFAPGAYRGTIVVHDSTGRHLLAERPVRVTIPQEPPAATAVTDTWTTEIYKGAPLPGLRTRLLHDAASRCAPSEARGRWLGRALRSLADRCVRDEVIPLAVVDTPGVMVGPGTVLGVLKDSAGDHAFVWWKGGDTAKAAAGGVTSKGLRLEFTSFDHPAIYTGPIDLKPGVPGGDVFLTVNVTHAMLWPLIAILTGVVLSYGLRRYLQAKRGILALQERSAELQAGFQRAGEEFELAVRGLPGPSRYGIDASMMKGFREADVKIHRLNQVAGALEAGNAQHDEVVRLLDGLEQDVAGWSAFGESLAGLHRDLARSRSAAASSAGRYPLAPKKSDVELADKAERLLSGIPIKRESLAELRQRVDAMRGLLTRFQELNEEVAEDAEALEQFAAGSPQVAEYDAVAQSLRNAWTQLWAACDVAQVDEAQLALASARKQVVTLHASQPASVLSPSSSPRMELETAEQTAAEPLLETTGAEPLSVQSKGEPHRLWIQNLRIWSEGPQTRAQQTARRARRRRWLYGVGYLAVTMAVAALTGLNQLYLDTPYFGTLRDYVLAVLWGFGAKLGMDVVRDALETRTLPWPDFLTLGRSRQATSPSTQEAAPALDGAGAPNPNSMG